MKVLTSNGFKDFDGIKKTYGYSSLLLIETNKNHSLKCTNNHLIRVKSGAFRRADELKVNDYINQNEYIVKITNVKYDGPVYDLINVKDGNHYITNGITSHNCVMIDEAAFVEHWDEFYKSTYPTISSGEETRLILISTFNGQNHFYDMWTDAIAKRSLFHPTRVDWWDVPGRDEKWHQDQLKIMSEEDFAQEYGNEALGSGFTLINSKGFSLVEASKKSPIQFTLTTKIYDVPIRGHKYMLTCDCADTGTDYSTISVIDITEFPYKQVATFRDNKITHLMFPHMILQLSVKYNDAAILVESNDVGKVILHILNYELECETVIRTRNGTKTQLGQRTTVKSKAIGCARLKDMIESGNLIIQDKATIEELKHFVIHNQTYSGEEGFHDDMVMGLVIFAYFVSSTAFRTEYDKNFVDEMNPQYEQEIIEALTPLPIFSNEKENPLDGLPKGFLD